jgi:ubiquinone/menaquinone biosynthesis C-methylase UbiE
MAVVNTFKKYDEFGSYHWIATYPENILKRSPRVSAIYEVPIDIVKDRMAISFEESTGLDVGCGDAVLVFKVLSKKGKIIGIDLTPKGLGLGREEILKRNTFVPMLINASSYSIPIPADYADYIVSTELIEHLNDEDAFLSEITRTLKNRGVFVCTTPYKRPDILVQDPYHVREYTPDELSALLGKYFSQVEIFGLFPMWLDKLYLHKNKILRFLFRGIIKGTSLLVNPYRLALKKATSIRQFETIVGVASNPIKN